MIEAVCVMMEVFGVFIIAVCFVLISICFYDYFIERKNK